MTRPLIRLAAALALASAPALSSAAFSLLSLRSDGTPPTVYTDGVTQPSITPDGRFVVYSASATNLVTPDAAGFQVYLRDRVLGTTELVSVSLTGVGGNASSSGPTISDDGCRVVYNSYASDLIAGDANGGRDIFLRERCGPVPTTYLVNTASDGTYADSQSYTGRISGNGRKVAFNSYATNLVPGLANAGVSCLYVKDLSTGITTAPTANGVCVESATPDLSFDGSRMAFWAIYEPGTVSTINDVWQIWLWDFNAPSGSEYTLVSTNASAIPQFRTDPLNAMRPGEGSSTVTEPAISRDGGFVAFRSRGWGLDAIDGGGISHVFVKNLATGAITKVSVSSTGELGNGDSAGTGEGQRPGISNYGSVIAFLSNSTNLAASAAGAAPNVFAHKLYTGETVAFTSTPSLTGQPDVTASGDQVVAYSPGALDPAFASRGMFVFGGLATQTSDLTVSQSVAPTAVEAGKDLVYRFTVTNTGPDAVTGATVTDALPAGIDFIWASPGCTQAAGTVTCALGSIEVGGSRVVTLVTRPSNPGTATNVVVVSAPAADPGPNNTSSLTTQVFSTPVGVPVLRYRLYSPVTSEHMYTTSLNEYNTLGSYSGTWVQEGTVGNVLDNPGVYNGVTATPYYRLYNSSNAQHHWTSDANEYYTLAQFPQYGAEGVDGYVLRTQAPGTIPLYRLMYPYSTPVAGLHHWTIDQNEYDTLIANYGWIGEGGLDFVIP